MHIFAWRGSLMFSWFSETTAPPQSRITAVLLPHYKSPFFDSFKYQPMRVGHLHVYHFVRQWEYKGDQVKHGLALCGFPISGPCKLSHRVTSTVGWLGRTGVGGHVKREPTPDLIGSDQEGKWGRESSNETRMELGQWESKKNCKCPWLITTLSIIAEPHRSAKAESSAVQSVEITLEHTDLLWKWWSSVAEPLIW